MVILGIDASSQKTGLALYNKGLVGHALLDFSYNREYMERFKLMAKGIHRYIEDNRPDVVYAEDTWEKGGGFNNTATLKKLSYLLGAVMYMCSERNVPFNFIYPSEWRKVIGFKTGGLKRDELKRLSIDYVAENYGMDVNDDVADAICIAEAGHILNNKLFE